MAVETTALEAGTKVEPRLPRQVFVIAAVVVALLVGGRVITPDFLTVDNMLSILRAGSIIGIIALGLTFITLSGNYFSLSVAQTAVMASVLYAAAASLVGGLLALLVTVVACVVLGLVQGGVVGAGGNPVVVSLATGALLLGIILVLTDSNRVVLRAPGNSFAVWVGRGTVAGVPTTTIAFVLAAVAAHFLLKRTVLGRRCLLVGANRLTAVASGMNVRAVVTAAFCISSLAAGLAGVLTAAEFGVADSTQFNGVDIDAVAAVLVGGTSIKGGEGSILRTCVGTVFIALLRNLLQVLGLSTGIQLLCVGGAVVVAVSVYALTNGRSR
jgi:ribose transport system permease protein